MSGSTVSGWPCALLAVLAAANAGCASRPNATPLPPEAAASPLQPVAHESRQAVAERAYFFSAVYAFEIDGHRYELANASDANRTDNVYELVFIDGELACSRDIAVHSVSDLDSDVTSWEWVSEPGGLEYLADRLWSGCGLAAPTPQAVSDLNDDKDENDKDSVQAGERAHEDGGTAQVAGAVAVGTAYGALAFIPLYGPLIQLLVAAIADVSHSQQTIDFGKGQDKGYAKLRLAQSPEQLLALLGEPDVTFELPKVGVQVKAFKLEDVHPYYIGVLDGRPVWFHAEYPWLKQLATQALEEGKKGR